MDSTLDRLRRLQRLRPQKKSEEPSLPAPAPRPAIPEAPVNLQLPPTRKSRSTKLETLIPGEEVETEFGPVYVVTKRYPLDEIRGLHSAGDLLHHTPNALADLHPNFNLHNSDSFAHAAFIDTETTGLGGGAGIYAFMVGIGTYERVAREPSGSEWRVDAQSPAYQYVVRQLFMRNPAEEPALLSLLATLLADKTLTVTFNGRGFDLPLLRTRYFFNRGLVPNGDMPVALEEDGVHLDLLMPARRLWKRRLQSCRLINLEAQILGLQRTGEDVPGQLIPQLYVDYVNTNDARALQGVFYHNHEDVLTMVGLATELYRTAAPNATRPPAQLDGLDWLSLGQMYELQSKWTEAEAAYCSAVECLSVAIHQADSFARLAALYKRLERWQEATETWERWLTTVAGADATPYIELAKYYEWRNSDLEQAEMWVKWAIHTLNAAPIQQRIPGQLAELEHRLARIQRKRSNKSE